MTQENTAEKLELKNLEGDKRETLASSELADFHFIVMYYILLMYHNI